MSGGLIRNRLLLGGLAAVYFLGAGGSVFAADGGMRTLHGNVPPTVAHLTSIGNLSATRQLNLAIGLPLHNQPELDELLRQLYDPASPNFHKFLTPEEFTARFGPTEADYAAVRDFARTNGMVVTGTYDDRLLLDVAGPAAAVQSAFHVTLRTYHHPTENRDFFAPDTEPTVESNLPIADVSGLQNYSRPRPKFHFVPRSLSPRAGSAPGSEYMGNDFRNAYVPGTTLDGSGQMVGLVQFDGFYASDITAYESVAGRTNIPLQVVKLDGFSGTPTTGANTGNPEVSLDIEMAMSMAPALARIVVFEGNPNNFIPNDVLNAMVASNTVKNLSCSWGWSVGPTTTTDNIFKMMAADGQSFFNASGDSDAFPPGYVDNSASTTTPSSSPYITQVGGTTLTMNGSGASYNSETVWNWGYDSSAGGYVGTSGGVSSYYAIPAWQQGVNSFSTNGGSTTMRNIPDVALTADNVYVTYGNGSTGDFGGTSCAAPLWAGFMALVNQQAAAGGQANGIGFINPAIYEIANESIYNSAFNDITTGNNTWPSSPDSFYAVPGYDLCTGLGTPAGTALIYALVNPDPLVVVSNAGFNAVISPDGTSSIGSQ
ncbi:MAG TPA: S53 family peptidase, partial [Verrucomicrobiae bacterium]